MPRPSSDQDFLRYLYYIENSKVSLQAIEPELVQLSAPETFSIGIHVRLGDQVLHGGEPEAATLEGTMRGPLSVLEWFNCAEQVATSIGLSAQIVRFAML